MTDSIKRGGDDKSREPILNAPAGQPLGTGVGPVSPRPSGASGGTGSLDRIEAGRMAGGLASEGSQEAINPTTEDHYWRENYAQRPYAAVDRPYEHYQPAYRYGWEARERHGDRRWEEVEPELEREWRNNPAAGVSQLAWHEARLAVRDAWERVERQHPGESNRAPR